MADNNLRVAEAPTEPPLERQLRDLTRRVGDMEDALRGVAGVLHAIQAGGLLDHLPPDDDSRPGHCAATAMLTLLHRQVDALVEHEEDWDASCELSLLADKAKDGRLIRYSRPVAE